MSWNRDGERYDVYDTPVHGEVVPLGVNVDTGGK